MPGSRSRRSRSRWVSAGALRLELYAVVVGIRQHPLPELHGIEAPLLGRVPVLAELALGLRVDVAADRIGVLTEKRPIHPAVQLLHRLDGVGHQIAEVSIDDPIWELTGCAPLCQEDHHGAEAGIVGLWKLDVVTALPAHGGERAQARGLRLEWIAVGVDHPGIGIRREEQVDEHQIEGRLQDPIARRGTPYWRVWRSARW